MNMPIRHCPLCKDTGIRELTPEQAGWTLVSFEPETVYLAPDGQRYVYPPFHPVRVHVRCPCQYLNVPWSALSDEQLEDLKKPQGT